MRNIPFFGLFFWFGRIAWAQEELNLPEVGPPSTFQGGVGVLRFVVAFLLVIVILWAFFVLLRKFAGQSARISSSKYMRVVDILPVRGNLSFYLIQVGERIVMVVQSGNTVREVVELHSDELVENPSPQKFSSYLDTLFRRKTHEGKKVE
jgi:flagellar biogenesis protein FliO